MRKGGIFLAGVLVALATFGPQGALADEAATIYDPSTVVVIDLTLSPAAEAELEAEPGEYVDGEFELTQTSDGTPGGEESTPLVPAQPAKIRLKGSVGGSFRELGEKPGIKLKFDDEEPVLGLHKMTLNNMVQDPSMVHETLAYAAFRANGVAASRTGYDYVRLNGHDIGVYLDLENLDDIALAKIFGSFDKDTGQHLYEGEYGDDVVPGAVEDFEADEGKDHHREDLEALIEAVNGEGQGPWSERVAPYAELTEMARFWAIEKYIDHWDGYSGHAIPGFRPNNYYLYSDTAGRFQMLPWGTDQAWVFTEGEREVTFDGEGGVLFNKCLEDENCFRLYWEALNLVTHTVPGLDPGPLAEGWADLLAPWQGKERADGRPDPDSDQAEEIEAALSESLEFIAGRQAEAEEWLAANVPPEEVLPEGEDDSRQPAGQGSDTGSAKSAAPRAKPRPRLTVGRSSAPGGPIRFRLHVFGPGRVVGIGTVGAGKGRIKTCAVHTGVRRAKTLKLRCRLNGKTRRRLRRHWLRLTIRVRFVPISGRPKVITRRVNLRRIRSH